MTSFADLGVQVQRSFVTNRSSLNAGGLNVSLSNEQTTKYVLTLPRPSPIRASFRKESWGDALVKIFKKEIQTGDAEFDKLIYISTDTTEETTAFLRSPELRNALALAVDTGGPVEIDAARVTAYSIGHDNKDDPTLVRIVAALLG
ncbi:MAG: hypothetical protein HY898_16910 [Deltaproteobacteria bacterium]|nr:hypothetical protein [Deltaproteobacteria bacterium]